MTTKQIIRRHLMAYSELNLNQRINTRGIMYGSRVRELSVSTGREMMIHYTKVEIANLNRTMKLIGRNHKFKTDLIV